MEQHRKTLQDMTPAELQTWLAGHRAELEDIANFVQSYLLRRKRRGIHTLTDERYERFLAQAADLMAGLDEMQVSISEASQEAQ